MDIAGCGVLDGQVQRHGTVALGGVEGVVGGSVRGNGVLGSVPGEAVAALGSGVARRRIIDRKVERVSAVTESRRSIVNNSVDGMGETER